VHQYVYGKEVSCGIRIERLLGTSSLIKREQNAVMNLNCLESPDMSTSNFTKRKSLDKRKIPESIRRPTHAPNDTVVNYNTDITFDIL